MSDVKEKLLSRIKEAEEVQLFILEDGSTHAFDVISDQSLRELLIEYLSDCEDCEK